MTNQLHLGISTCPNDTFAFHGILAGEVDTRGIQFEIELLDIEQLNQRLMQGAFDIAKASFHAALSLASRYWVLPCGAALGFGVGPLLLAAKPNSILHSPSQLTLCPGEYTTAHLLYQLFYPHTTRIEQVLFSEIMPRLQSSQADFGVCIHEGRFTWMDQGLYCVEDLGSRWEAECHLPLPLGGILGSRNLDPQLLARATQVITDSIAYARQHPDRPLPTMRKFAQEFNDQVLMQHVDLYVNDWTVNLGETGKRALEELSRRGNAILGFEAQLEVFQPHA